MFVVSFTYSGVTHYFGYTQTEVLASSPGNAMLFPTEEEAAKAALPDSLFALNLRNYWAHDKTKILTVTDLPDYTVVHGQYLPAVLAQVNAMMSAARYRPVGNIRLNRGPRHPDLWAQALCRPSHSSFDGF